MWLSRKLKDLRIQEYLSVNSLAPSPDFLENGCTQVGHNVGLYITNNNTYIKRLCQLHHLHVQAHELYTLFYTKYIKLLQNYNMVTKTNDKLIV